ncbi:MAG: hypothetical protein NWT08_09950 [Akkermansiaceae bacterium]|nr:hypothetical protein [Akkermansiaceae bacterium]MDP4721207.1 hypothetical protein [Akkermansiaceae bacterium]MDP4778855.1 hypothetical protein [Akkermansiaceae bacterium]MDP4846944.1 hypothetical protein [Akkermansiaceae bacterium]MDP4897918.1 hypothetical protein [Akkermansiaceae bacterium]
MDSSGKTPTLTPEERASFRDFAKKSPIENPAHPALPILEFLKSISTLPPTLRPEKPVRFTGNHWKL